VVIDPGVGNLGNLTRAIQHLGTTSRITTDAEVVASARCLLLPGVGAFRPPRERLRGALEEALKEALANGAWLLGICVGFQLLFDASNEFGDTDGLGLIRGTVRPLPETVPLPHIGWNPLREVQEHPLVAGLDGAALYFVHSYAPEGVPEELVLARCRHGRDFPAVVGRGRVLGTQFHPEKSADAGLRLLSNYLEMAHGA
jgi:glutamine amidotransferase